MLKCSRSGYIAGVLKAGNGLVGLQAKVLETSPENTHAWSALSAKARELRQIFSGALVQIIGSLGMLELEVSYGRVSARDLKLLVEKSKVLVGRLMGVASFQVGLLQDKSSEMLTGLPSCSSRRRKGTIGETLRPRRKSSATRTSTGSSNCATS